MKYAYYLLAIAAAAIALALDRTAGMPLTIGHALLGVSLACWAFSFYNGCQYIAEYMAALRANAEAVSLPAANPESYAGAVAAGFQAVARDKAASLSRYWGRQWRWLATGAVFYVLWHVLGMALCTPSLRNDLARFGSCAAASASAPITASGRP